MTGYMTKVEFGNTQRPVVTLGWLRAGPPAEAADCQKRANMRD